MMHAELSTKHLALSTKIFIETLQNETNNKKHLRSCQPGSKPDDIAFAVFPGGAYFSNPDHTIFRVTF